MAFARSGSLLLAALFAVFAQAQDMVVVLTGAADLPASMDEVKDMRGEGIDVAVVVAPGCYLARIASAATADAFDTAARNVIADPANEDAQRLPADRRLALRYLAGLQAGTFDAKPTDPMMDWGGHPEHALERRTRANDPAPAAGGTLRAMPPGVEALDWSCSESNNSEYLWGIVVANTFFLESNGTIDPNNWTWTTPDIDNVKLQMIDAWSIWSYTAGLHGRTITAVMTWYEPSGGMSVTGYEPVTRSSGQDYLWINACMANLGYTGGTFSALDAFNHDRRTTVGADHAATAFIAYNPAPSPSQFTDGKIGYAYLGGPYTQLLFRANGWSTSQINRVYGHELGHIFHAFDEYAASTSGNCTRYYNGAQNANYQGSTCNGTAGCVMINNAFSGSGATRSWNLCAHTPTHLGWYGLPPVPVPLAPIDQDTVYANPVVFAWNRNAPPSGVTGYVKVFNHGSGALVYCGHQGGEDTLLRNLVNGTYRWQLSQGLANDYNGYGGVIAEQEIFTVIAPLNADFSPTTAVTICAGNTATFTDQSTGAPTSWTWSFPGGTPSSFNGQLPPPVTYTVPGSYTVTLTAGDGITTHVRTRTNIVVVTGGAAVPFGEAFESGIWPPTGWSLQGGGTVGGQGGLGWIPDTTFSCSMGISAHVPVYGTTGYAYPMLTTPKIDLVNVPDPYISFAYSYAQKVSTTTETLRLLGHDCTYGVYGQPEQLGGAQLATNGGALQASPAWVPSSCAHWRTGRASLAQFHGRIAQIDFRLDCQGGQNVFVDDVNVYSGCRLTLRAMLEGPFLGGTGLMSTQLHTLGLLPATEPYTGAGYVFEGEGGGEVADTSMMNATGPDAPVDWVVVEVRAASDPTRVLTARAAILQADGDIVDPQGATTLRVGVQAGSYHVAVRHRNHLGAMTAVPIALSQTTPLLDLTLPTTATWGTDARKVNGATALLWAGDVQRDGVLRYTGAANDRDPILSAIGGMVPTATVSGYRAEDCTLDGVVKYTGAGNDRDPILNNIGGTVPTSTRVQQIP